MAEIVYTKSRRDGDYSKETEIRAEGCDEFIKQIATQLIGQKKGQTAQTAKPRQVGDIEHDVVAIYDNAGIPSFMHRFRKITNRELFGGSEKTHPAFIIDGEEYDEIFISVYENTMINGKPYSLPYAKPVTDITIEEFAKACFSKGEGWHCMTAVEWGLLANLSLKNGTLPHGNTKFGKYHADENEKGKAYAEYGKILTGSGPKTWTHDHTPTGVHDLCGNILEFCAGMRIKDGVLYSAKNNDAALPETDISENGKDWREIKDDNGRTLRVSVDKGEITITCAIEYTEDYCGCEWKEVSADSPSEQMKELAFYAGEPEAYCWMDSTEGEYILIRGGGWRAGASAGVFSSNLDNPRSYVLSLIGGRSAYFKKHSTPVTETPTAER